MGLNNRELELRVIWDHLDNACGSLDNALINLGSVEGLNSEIEKSMDGIDFSVIVSLKNMIEEQLEKTVV